MSELKATSSGEIRAREALLGYWWYEKSEADKVMAELEENHKAEVKELLCLIRDKENNFNRAFDSEEKEIRHQKYKRCFKMARWCAQMMVFNSKYGTAKKWHLFKKWRKRWLELAEKFKEAK